MNHVATPAQPTAIANCSPWVWAVPAVSAVAAMFIWLTDLNQSLFLLLNGLGRGELASLFWVNATLLGDVLVAFCLLGLFAQRRFDIVWALLLAALLSTAWVHIPKNLLDVLRPLAVLGADAVHVIGVPLYKHSFPSGHTATAFTLAGIICLQRVPPALAFTALILATLAGISRSVVGAHWPLDILAGAFGGWLCAFFGVLLARRWPTPESPLVRGGIILVLLICAVTLLSGMHDSGYAQTRDLQIVIGSLSLLALLYALWTQHFVHRKL
jgi:membrane-associated phospholipid phosphatase